VSNIKNLRTKQGVKLETKKVKNNIFTFLQEVKDPRDTSGRRHNLAVVLLINIMSIMSGYNGILAKQDFIDRNKEELMKLFDPKLVKHGLPSKNSIDRVMQDIDYSELNQVLEKFLKNKLDKDNTTDTPLHIDGKTIRGTVENPNGKQTFTAIVSIFSNNGVVESKEYVNGEKNKSELVTVKEVIKNLELENMVLTLDALHCQKKQ